MNKPRKIKRCAWALDNELEQIHHDEEWGVPLHDDRKLFEMLTLESAQSGLSWATILRKRAGYLKAFDNFDAAKVAQYDEAKYTALLNNADIVRHRQKISATINNAQRVLEMQTIHGSFDRYIWSYVDGEPIVNRRKSPADVPASTPQSIAMSKGLKKDGFKFMGPTTCYAFMQATGMVNDHLLDCFRYPELEPGV